MDMSKAPYNDATLSDLPMGFGMALAMNEPEIGRASCRERV